jgi:hypothetical protein
MFPVDYDTDQRYSSIRQPLDLHHTKFKIKEIIREYLLIDLLYDHVHHRELLIKKPK